MAARKDRTTVSYKGFYWTGIVMVLACLAFVLAGNTEFGYGLEHTRFPLSWAFAAAAIVAFIAAELAHPADSSVVEEQRDSEPVSDWEAVEV